MRLLRPQPPRARHREDPPQQGQDLAGRVRGQPLVEPLRVQQLTRVPCRCPRCTKTCTCSHCRVRIGGKRKGEFSDGLEEEYETLLRDQHEAKLAAGGSDSRGTSCHYCRQKKSLFVECNKSRFHRWCSSCVKNGFGLDFGELLRNKDKVWPMGCPICQKTCTCSLCKRRALAKAQKNGGDNELANALMGISAENRKPPPRARRPKAPKTLPGSGPGFGRRQMDLPPSARAGYCKSDRCHGGLMDMREEQSLVDENENGEDQAKLPHAMTVASFNTVMAQGSPTGASGERESDQTKDAGLLLDMLAQACDGPESSPSPAKDMQMAPTSFFAAAAAQESAKAHFADLASSPRQQQAAAAPAVPMEREQAEDPQQPAPGEPVQPPPDCQDKLPPPTSAALPAAAAVSSGGAASASSAEAEAAPEGSPCPSTGSDSPPFSPSLAPGENGEQPTELQLPQSPRAGNSPRFANIDWLMVPWVTRVC